MSLNEFEKIIKYFFIFLVVLQVFFGVKKGRKKMAASDKFVNRFFVPMYLVIGLFEIVVMYRL